MWSWVLCPQGPQISDSCPSSDGGAQWPSTEEERSSKNKGQDGAGASAAWVGNSLRICLKWHAGKKSHICPEGPANVTVFSSTHLSGPVECHSTTLTLSNSWDRAFSFLSKWPRVKAVMPRTLTYQGKIITLPWVDCPFMTVRQPHRGNKS